VIAKFHPDYPLIRCDEPGHERPEPGYVVCGHVLNDDIPVFDIERATKQRIGVIACKDCFEARTLDLNTSKCVCAHCAAMRGWLGKELN
jgi:hypothetical protein